MNDRQYYKQIREARKKQKECGHKKKYLTKDEVKFVLKKIRKQTKDNWLEWYICSYCNNYHIGHPKGNYSKSIAAINYKEQLNVTQEGTKRDIS